MNLPRQAMLDFATSIAIVGRKDRLLEYVRLRTQGTRSDEAKKSACRVRGDARDETHSLNDQFGSIPKEIQANKDAAEQRKRLVAEAAKVAATAQSQRWEEVFSQGRTYASVASSGAAHPAPPRVAAAKAGSNRRRWGKEMLCREYMSAKGCWATFSHNGAFARGGTFDNICAKWEILLRGG